ncbi:hypothetical protein FIBSPDRAFT_875646 [Athelia psychrophila]|uniref:Uncharacterized protein n=1 Tax=Athelia psychrophila TaxID=1759441 RepID=A0A167XKN7_9AGAM|nr:hypothetical protein FIBSPDRAFT_875646 [Fibularhizoctonia sp. CBS 109695]
MRISRVTFRIDWASFACSKKWSEFLSYGSGMLSSLAAEKRTIRCGKREGKKSFQLLPSSDFLPALTPFNIDTPFS